MLKTELVIDKYYKGYNPVIFGYEDCDSGHSFGPHVRTHWLLHYIVSGFGIFEKDGVRHSVRPGDMFVIPPYEETYYEADREKPWRYIWIGFTTEESLPSQFSEAVIHCPGVGDIFEDMLRCGKMDNGRSAFLSAKIWELCSVLLEGSGSSADYIEKALNYMRSEYVNGITIQQISDRLNINRSYLSEIFKARMGVSPQQYLVKLRLEKAAELLSIYNETPTTAANSVGYSDIYHFSKIFKQHFGVPPRSYKQLHSQ